MSGLFYFGTTDEMRLGDRVEIKLFLRSKQRGVVTYIPALSARELAAQKRDADEWIITADDGVSYGAIYSPEDHQPRSNVRLVSRGPADFVSLSPEQLDASEIREPPSPWQALGCVGIAILIGLIISVAVVLWRVYIR